jgi:hypothetical protein
MLGLLPGLFLPEERWISGLFERDFRGWHGFHGLFPWFFGYQLWSYTWVDIYHTLGYLNRGISYIYPIVGYQSIFPIVEYLWIPNFEWESMTPGFFRRARFFFPQRFFVF